MFNSDLIPNHTTDKLSEDAKNKRKTSGSKVTKSKDNSSPEKKKTRKKISFLIQQQLIGDHKNGMTQGDICRKYELPRSTVSDIVKREKTIQKFVQEAPFTHFKETSRAVSDLWMEMNLRVGNWILLQAARGKAVSMSSIQSKAKEVQKSMVSGLEKKSNIAELKEKNKSFFEFSASRGWFHRFKGRADLKHVKIHGESGSADHEAAEKSKEEFLEYIQECQLDHRQIFNADETGLQWKKDATGTFIPTTFAPPEGYKVDKRRITILFGGNAAGHKLTPFIINQFKNPRALANVNPEDLGINSSNNLSWNQLHVINS
jgi:predicted XRE-type DNA-binding protein